MSENPNNDSTEQKPVIADKMPAVIKLEAGEYWWCSCGKSSKQPFCDGSHQGSSFLSSILVSQKATLAPSFTHTPNPINKGSRQIREILRFKESVKKYYGLITASNEPHHRRLHLLNAYNYKEPHSSLHQERPFEAGKKSPGANRHKMAVSMISRRNTTNILQLLVS